MKTQNNNKPMRASVRQKERSARNCAEAVRLCEEAAARIKTASDELSAGWIALGLEISLQGSATDLLRKRAWCNVLELRLKERTRALQDARHAVDAAWNDVMMSARGQELFKRHHGQSAEANLFHKSWSLLLQPKSAAMARPRITVGSK